MARAHAVATKATDRSIRAAKMMREKRSRPYMSVPSQWRQEGAPRAAAASGPSGPYGAINGAKMAARAINAITHKAAKETGLRRIRRQVIRDRTRKGEGGDSGRVDINAAGFGGRQVHRRDRRR